MRFPYWCVKSARHSGLNLTDCSPHRLPFCEHVICYTCLNTAFIDELRRRAMICTSIPEHIRAVTHQSPPSKLARLASAVEQRSYKLSYPCPVCSIRTSDPPIPARALSEVIDALLPSQISSERISNDQDTFDVFFPSHCH